MPDYTYFCFDCKKRFTVFLTYAEFDTAKVTCPHCQGEKVTRRLGRVRFARSEESRMDALADPTQLDNFEDDPKAMAKLMRQISSEAGTDPGEEFGEVLDRLEKGQSPEEIEQELPDLGGAESNGAGFGGEDF